MSEQPKKSFPFLPILVIGGAVAIIAWNLLRPTVVPTNTNDELPYQMDTKQIETASASSGNWKEVRSIPLTGKDFGGLACDNADNIYVGIGKSVLQIDPQGNTQTTIALPLFADAIAADDNKIYIAQADYIQVYDTNGNQLNDWPSLGKRAQIRSIAVSADSLYAADFGNRMVWRFSLTGEMLGQFAGPEPDGFFIPSPYFDVVSATDGVVMVDPGRHTISKRSDDLATEKSSWGSYGNDVSQFLGCCNPSHIAMLADGRFITSEKGIARVKLYDESGKFIEVIAGPDLLPNRHLPLEIATTSKDEVIMLDAKAKMIRVFAAR